MRVDIDEGGHRWSRSRHMLPLGQASTVECDDASCSGQLCQHTVPEGRKGASSGLPKNHITPGPPAVAGRPSMARPQRVNQAVGPAPWCAGSPAAAPGLQRRPVCAPVTTAPEVSATRTKMQGWRAARPAHHVPLMVQQKLSTVPSQLAWGLAAVRLRGFGALGVTLSATAAAVLALRFAGVTAALGLGGDADGCASSSCSSSASSKPSGRCPVVCCHATDHTAPYWCYTWCKRHANLPDDQSQIMRLSRRRVQQSTSPGHKTAHQEILRLLHAGREAVLVGLAGLVGQALAEGLQHALRLDPGEVVGAKEAHGHRAAPWRLRPRRYIRVALRQHLRLCDNGFRLSLYHIQAATLQRPGAF